VADALKDAVVKHRASTVELDFSDSVKVYPNGIVPIIIQNDFLRKKHNFFTHIIPPRENQCRILCEVSNWFHYLDEGSIEWRKNSWQNLRSFPLLRFDSETELNELVHKAVEITTSQALFGTGIKRVFQWALNEIAGNVLDHSGNSYGWMQVTTFGKEKEIHITIGDSGFGIPKTIGVVASNYDDASAILKAMEKGVTRDKSIGQGNGLAGTLSIVKHCSGRLDIWSHKGHVHKAVGAELYNDNVSARLEGTVVEYSMKFDKEVDLPNVLWGNIPLHYDEFKYEDEMGNMAIPLAELGTNFGNRTTGERLRNHILNLMKESPTVAIVIDMKEITVISSSFADELFGKLVTQIGFMAFNQKVKFKDVDPVCRQIIDNAVVERLSAK
jgi:anti-sigma regulatory factor (Ser/Thr protein kinase)